MTGSILAHIDTAPIIPVPQWVWDLVGAGLAAVAVVLFVACFSLAVYVATLAYGWVPSLMLRRKRHLLWLLPVVSTAGLLAWVYGGARDDGRRLHFTWIDALITLDCVLSSALAALTIVVVARLLRSRRRRVAASS